MSMLTKPALGMMGQPRPRPANGRKAGNIVITAAARKTRQYSIGLTHDQQMLLSQTVGYAKIAS